MKGDKNTASKLTRVLYAGTLSILAWGLTLAIYSFTSRFEEARLEQNSVQSDVPVIRDKLRSPVGASPTRIKDRILKSLQAEPSVDLQNLHVEVTPPGTVTLSGYLESLPAKLTTLRIVRSLKGVQQVYSTLEVRPKEQLSDQEIGSTLQSILLSDPEINADLIDLTVENGTVILSGTVRSHRDRWKAEDLATHVQGVRAVKNELVVKIPPQETLQGTQLKKRIEDDIARNALVDYKDTVEVQTEGSTVILKGKVKNMTEHASIMRDALESGASLVINELKIQDPPETLLEAEYYSIDPDDNTSFGRYIYDPPWSYDVI